MGAESRNLSIDFSPYSDWQTLSPDVKNKLITYVVELGYGGNDKKMLNPYNKITRAEAAVIISRVLDWKANRKQQSLALR